MSGSPSPVPRGISASSADWRGPHEPWLRIWVCQSSLTYRSHRQGSQHPREPRVSPGFVAILRSGTYPDRQSILPDLRMSLEIVPGSAATLPLSFQACMTIVSADIEDQEEHRLHPPSELPAPPPPCPETVANIYPHRRPASLRFCSGSAPIGWRAGPTRHRSTAARRIAQLLHQEFSRPASQKALARNVADMIVPCGSIPQ